MTPATGLPIVPVTLLSPADRASGSNASRPGRGSCAICGPVARRTCRAAGNVTAFANCRWSSKRDPLAGSVDDEERRFWAVWGARMHLSGPEYR